MANLLLPGDVDSAKKSIWAERNLKPIQGDDGGGEGEDSLTRRIIEEDHRGSGGAEPVPIRTIHTYRSTNLPGQTPTTLPAPSPIASLFHLTTIPLPTASPLPRPPHPTLYRLAFPEAPAPSGYRSAARAYGFVRTAYRASGGDELNLAVGDLVFLDAKLEHAETKRIWVCGEVSSGAEKRAGLFPLDTVEVIIDL